MKFWKVEIKYTKIAIPDTIYFNNKSQAEYFIESKEKNNSMVVWTKISDKPIEIKEL